MTATVTKPKHSKRPLRRATTGMLWGLDTETTGAGLHHGCKPFFVSACSEDGDIRCWEWDVDPMTREPQFFADDLDDLKSFVSDNDFVLHNAKFDIRALWAVGVSSPDWNRIQDTLIASHVLASSESHKLKDLCLQLLDISDDDQQELKKATTEARRIGRKKGWRIAAPGDDHFPALKQAPKDGWWVLDTWLPRAVAKDEGYPPDHPWWTVLKTYALLDAERTIGLWMVLRDALQEEGLEDIYKTRLKLLPATYRMEQHGITASTKRLEKARDHYAAEAERSERLCYRLSGNAFDNVRSPKQLQGVLYGTFKLDPVKETKTGYATDADTLRVLQTQIKPSAKAYQFVKHLMSTRKLSKAGDYLDSYQRCGIPIDPTGYLVLHPNFNITGTATTRLSSSDPNAQNISKQEDFNLRQVFGPFPGHEWWSMDYSNIELRIFAYASGDKELIAAFEQGESVHLVIADVLRPKELRSLGPEGFKKTDQYRWIKNGDFALIYGASPRKADATYRVPGAYDRIRKMLPKIDEFIQSKSEEGRRRGYVTTLGGYRLQVPRGEPHKAANYFVQGSAGWAMVLAINRTDEYLQFLGKDYRCIMTIHDELDFDFPRRKGNKAKVRKLKRLMEQSGDDLGLPTPVEVDRITTSWAKGEGVFV